MNADPRESPALPHRRQRPHPPLGERGDRGLVQFLMDAHQIVVAAGEEGIRGIGQIEDARRALGHRFGKRGAECGEQGPPCRIVGHQRVERICVPPAQGRRHHRLRLALGQHRNDGIGRVVLVQISKKVGARTRAP
jgi:hypothetical protein